MKYNKKNVAPVVATVRTHQGGTGFALKPEIELLQLLASGITNTYYEKESTQDNRLDNLIKEVGSKNPELVAKMLVYTRAVIGQRSVTHRGSVALMPLIAGNEWGKYFFTKRDRKENFGGVVYRIDDMLEIAACYFALNPGKRLPNSMVKGFKQVFENSDAYELAKYKGEGKSVKLVDLVNLVHPKPSKEMKKVFHDLVFGELKQFNTVEDKNTKAGQIVAEKVKEGTITKAEAKVELAKAKEETYKTLVEDKTIGYLALLRNLRNILANSNDADLIKNTVRNLTDEKAIRKSLVMPHQIDLALEVLLSELGSKANVFIKALNDAYELSIPNLSELGAMGKTVVIIDRSGSMTTKIHIGKGVSGHQAAIEKASLIGATLAKGLSADVYGFDETCYKLTFNPNDSVNTIKNGFINSSGGTTNFSSIFPALRERYDRVFIISDMQGSDAIDYTLADYKKRFNVDPYIYSINLCGYSNTMVKPGSKVFSLAGYTSEIYENIKKYEVNYFDILKEVQKINFVPNPFRKAGAILAEAKKEKSSKKKVEKKVKTTKKKVAYKR